MEIPPLLVIDVPQLDGIGRAGVEPERGLIEHPQAGRWVDLASGFRGDRLFPFVPEEFPVDFSSLDLLVGLDDVVDQSQVHSGQARYGGNGTLYPHFLS